MFSFKNFFKKEQWRLVKTFDINVSNRSSSKGKIYYHLFESDRHSRRISYATTLPYIDDKELTESAERFEIYQERLYRWLNGRVDPDIPTYNQVPEEETANVLKGKIS